MWKLSDIDPAEDYVIQLCHDPSGHRRLRLRAPNCEERHPHAIFETEVVPHEVLRRRNVSRIAKEVRLVGGGSFEFDAHGIWFTPEELDALEKNDGDSGQVQWSSQTPPVLAPR